MAPLRIVQEECSIRLMRHGEYPGLRARFAEENRWIKGYREREREIGKRKVGEGVARNILASPRAPSCVLNHFPVDSAVCNPHYRRLTTRKITLLFSNNSSSRSPSLSLSLSFSSTSSGRCSCEFSFPRLLSLPPSFAQGPGRFPSRSFRKSGARAGEPRKAEINVDRVSIRTPKRILLVNKLTSCSHRSLSLSVEPDGSISSDESSRCGRKAGKAEREGEGGDTRREKREIKRINGEAPAKRNAGTRRRQPSLPSLHPSLPPAAASFARVLK